MGRRNMKRMIIAGLAGLALAAAPLAASQAASHPNATLACHAAFGQCATPVIAVSSVSALDLTPADDFALQYTGGGATGVAYGTVSTNFSNSVQDGTEDWTWIQDATVPATGKGAFKFTAFDRANFPNAGVWELEYTPNGTDTNLCLTISSRYRSNGAVLGNCISAAQQSFIVTAAAVPNLVPAPAGYSYVFDVSQAANIQHHLALLAPHPASNGELIAAGNAVHVGAGKASLNEWASIP
jgi:hypothetical protein